MKGLMLGVVGIGGVGTAGYYGFGGSSPDDFIRTTTKSPQAVYAAMAGLGQNGEHVLPSPDGKHRMKMRVVKVPNEQIKIDFLVDDTPLVSGEVQLTAEGTGTRIAAELDVDIDGMVALAEEAGAGPVVMPIPDFAGDFVVDRVFAEMMDDMIDRIEQGKPLLSLAESRDRWGREERVRSGPGSRTTGTEIRPVQSTRPQLDTRPAIDPDAAARRHLNGSRPGALD